MYNIWSGLNVLSNKTAHTLEWRGYRANYENRERRFFFNIYMLNIFRDFIDFYLTDLERTHRWLSSDSLNRI